MNDVELQELLDELLSQIQTLHTELAALHQDVRTVLENMPMQMIGDPNSEVQ
jgi:regulator of replication initiation timing